MPDFDEIQFPADISQGAQGGPVFSTNVTVMTSGREFRNRNWRRALHHFEVSHALLSPEFAFELFEFFLARQARTKGFRFKWWRDYSTDQPTPGVTHAMQQISSTVFQLQKIYESGGVTYSRAIAKPVTGTLTVFEDTSEVSSGWTCDYTTGRVTFGIAPGYIPNASFEFDVPVRFDIDSMQVLDEGLTGEWQRIPLVEILYANPAPAIDPIEGFCEVQFPIQISDGASGGPKFATTIIGAESGAEKRVNKWPRGRHMFEVSHALRDSESAAELSAFFYCRGGRHQGFRFHYWRDYSTDQPIIGAKHNTLMLTSTTFQLQKTYGSTYTYTRTITKPVIDTVTIYDDMSGLIVSGWTVDTETGIVTFGVAPGYLPKASFEFDIPVRFDTDEMKMTDDDSDVYSWPSISIVEIL